MNKAQTFKKLLRLPIMICIVMLAGCSRPKEDIVLKQVRDVVVDANTDPTLKAVAVFYNPNKISGKLKNIDVDIIVNGKKAGRVNTDYKIKIPGQAEFTVPLEVKLNMKELGTFDTILGMLGAKKFDVQYVGSLKLNYRGIPIKVPVNHKDQIRVSF